MQNTLESQILIIVLVILFSIDILNYVLAYNAHLRGKIELAKIGERSEQNSQLYFVPL